MAKADLESRVKNVDVEAVRRFLRDIGVEHLDDVVRKVTNKYLGFWTSIGVKRNKGYIIVNDAKNRLVELGLFKPSIKDYDEKVQSKIITKILRPSGPMFNSYYICEAIDKDILSDNIKIVFNELKRREGIEHLDDINTTKSEYNAFWCGIGAKKSQFRKDANKYFKINDIKNRLVELGLLKPSIKDYDEKVQSKIIKKILRPSGSFNSYYLCEAIDKDILSDNIKIVFNELKRREGIEHLDDITAEIVVNYRGFLFDICAKKSQFRKDANKYFKINDIKNRLVELGLFKPSIKDYDEKVQSKIIKKILRPGSFNSYYICEAIDKDILSDNIKIVFNELKRREGMEHLDDITAEIVANYTGFWCDIGAKKSQLRKDGKKHFKVNDIKNRLIELKLFKPGIKDYDEKVQSEIIKKILRPSGSFNSYYLCEAIDKDILSDNIKIVFNELKRRGIEHLDDITNKIIADHIGFWGSIDIKKTKKNCFSISYVKTGLIHLNFFDKDVENKYKDIKVTGTALDLLKKLDCSLFGYKDIKFDDNKVDKSSYLVFKKVYKEAKEEGVELNNCLELFEYYNKKYSTQKG